MKRLIFTTVILVAAAVAITVVYFKNLSIPGQHTSKVIQSIPDDASLIFEFNNDKGFYDIFAGSDLLTSFTGPNLMSEFKALKGALIDQPALQQWFKDQHLFLSVHAVANKPEFLITMRPKANFDIETLAELAKQRNKDFVVNPAKIEGRQGYTIYVNSLKKRFFLMSKGDNIFTGSLSEELTMRSLNFKADDDEVFVQLSDQQNSNALANLYINYKQLTPLFNTLFKDPNNDLFKCFRSMTSIASLTMNYKSDALMFNGYTNDQAHPINTYLKLFAAQQPVTNRLRNVYPATTAYSYNFAVSDPTKFSSGLWQMQNDAKINGDRDALFSKIKTETGVDFAKAFKRQLSNEFGLFVTRYQERVAVIQLKNGLDIRPDLVNISTMVNDDIGQFNYDKLPFFLLGDPFSTIRRPYFRVVDNYLLLANNMNELNSYYESYINNKFLINGDDYNSFDALIADRSNATFFIYFKNMRYNLRQLLKPQVFKLYENNEPGWKNYSAAAYQLTTSDKNFYTNFCMQLSKRDTATVR